MRPILISLLLAVVGAPTLAEETLLILVRHAEKEASPGNPDLTERGRARAEALADIAVDYPVSGVYSTDFCRTAQTAQPTAVRLGMPIAVQVTGGATAGIEGCDPPIDSPVLFLDPRLDSVADLLSLVLEQHAGRAAVLVGHSNTVPRMLARLGLGVFEIADDEYDRMFLVTHDPVRGSRVVERSYGEHGDAIPVARLEIVDRAIEHHGGARYHASRTALTITSRSGSFRLEVRRDGPSFDYTVVDERDGRRRVTRLFNEGVERRLDGEAVELDADAARRARDFVFARVYFPFLPYGLNDPDVYKTDQGLEEWGGRLLRRVKVTFTPGSSTDASDDYAYWFDPETARLEQYAYSFGTGGQSGGLRFRRLSNYRRIGGILFFDAENLGWDAEGSRFTVDVIDPAHVAGRMQPISEVVLRDIEVEPLE